MFSILLGQQALVVSNQNSNLVMEIGIVVWKYFLILLKIYLSMNMKHLSANLLHIVDIDEVEQARYKENKKIGGIGSINIESIINLKV